MTSSSVQATCGVDCGAACIPVTPALQPVLGTVAPQIAPPSGQPGPRSPRGWHGRCYCSLSAAATRAASDATCDRSLGHSIPLNIRPPAIFHTGTWAALARSVSRRDAGGAQASLRVEQAWHWPGTGPTVGTLYETCPAIQTSLGVAKGPQNSFAGLE